MEDAKRVAKDQGVAVNQLISVWSAAASLRDAMADNLRMAPERRLVEAAGVEPASESTSS